MAASAAPSTIDAGEGNFHVTMRTPLAPDLGEAVDNLRAEVASTRAIIQQIKQQPNVLK